MRVETIESDSYVKDYYKAITSAKLTDMQYEALEKMSSYPTIGSKERLEMCMALKISQYNLNNIIAALKKKKYLLKTGTGKIYLWKYPPEEDEATIILKRK